MQTVLNVVYVDDDGDDDALCLFCSYIFNSEFVSAVKVIVRALGTRPLIPETV